MTMTGSEAVQAILGHHQSLGEGVARRAGALRESVGSGPGWEPAAAGLIAYLAEEVLPHAAAEEKGIYRAARVHPELDQPVVNMVGEHRLLADAAERLATTDSADEAVELATTISSLFTTHVQKENDVIVPLLDADPNVDLGALVDQMHRLTEAERRDAGEEGAEAVDTITRLTSLLLDAASGLAEAGHGDRACRLAAEAWALLRQPRPQLAVRVTAQLHHLVRAVTAEPVEFIPGPRPAAADHGGGAELDVRALVPAQRHEKIFATYGGASSGIGIGGGESGYGE